MKARFVVVLLVSVLLVTACSDGSDRPANAGQLLILVTNDDGIGSPGIERLVKSLLVMDNVEIHVVAPAENQSGSSDRTTEGDVVWQDSATAGGFAGVAVFGFPADAVNVALEELGITPDLVVSGVNQGQNVGPLAPLSGTVGAARFAARAGVPAVAASAGLGSSADFESAAELVVAWIEDNRGALANDSADVDHITSFNVPECTAGDIRGLVEVPRADSIPAGSNVFTTDCSVEPDSAPVSDVDAMIKGFAAETEVPLEFQ